MEIDCGPCLLRSWRSGDEDSLCRNANDREIWLNLRDGFPHPYTPGDARSWVELASTRANPTAFAIDVRGEAVGGIGLVLHDDIERVSAEIGYWLGRDFWGRGITSAAVRSFSLYSFREYDLTRIFAVPFARNTASFKVLEKAGYRREGLMRRSAIKEGKIVDQLLYALTDQDIQPTGLR